LQDFKRTATLIAFAFPVGFYTTFVIQCLWNWFAVPVFHLERASYWLIYGLNTLFGLLRERYALPEEQQWKRLFLVLDVCVPETRREHLMESIEGRNESEWVEFGFSIFGKVVSNSFVLGVGWVVYTFLL